MFRRRNSPTPDLFTPPDWLGDASAHLENLRLYAEKKIHDELNWYCRRRSGRSVTSQALRFLAVILSVFGGLVQFPSLCLDRDLAGIGLTPSNLAQSENNLMSQMEAGRPGGIDVEVTDGDKADTPVELSLGGMIADRFCGKAGSIGYVVPGLHRVTAKAHKNSCDHSASAMVNVGGGQICPIKLTLNIPQPPADQLGILAQTPTAGLLVTSPSNGFPASALVQVPVL